MHQSKSGNNASCDVELGSLLEGRSHMNGSCLKYALLCQAFCFLGFQANLRDARPLRIKAFIAADPHALILAADATLLCSVRLPCLWALVNVTAIAKTDHACGLPSLPSTAWRATASVLTFISSKQSCGAQQPALPALEYVLRSVKLLACDSLTLLVKFIPVWLLDLS